MTLDFRLDIIGILFLRQPMKIDINDLKEEITHFSVTETAEKLGFEGDCKFKGPVTAEIDIHNLGGKFKVTGNIKADFSMACSRCLKECESSVNTDFSIYHVKGISESSGEIGRDEADEILLTDDIINLDEDIRQTVFLELPMSIVCKDGCKGFCSICGADRNIKDCGCTIVKESPFNKIKLNGGK